REVDDRARSEAILAIALLAIKRKVFRAKVVRSAAVNYIERRKARGESNEKLFNIG
ncbi:hypothetical protein C8A01DRAFT_20894, partial [Parachaetomium inaequale]